MPVDQGVAPLVDALNVSKKVLTVNSCEADERGRPYVDFKYGRGRDDLIGFVEKLAKQLAPLGGYSLYIEWFGEDPQPRGRLAVRKDQVPNVAAVIKRAL